LLFVGSCLLYYDRNTKRGDHDEHDDDNSAGSGRDGRVRRGQEWVTRRAQQLDNVMERRSHADIVRGRGPVRLPRARPRHRGASGVPRPPDRGLGQLGPPRCGRDRREASGHHLRQPRRGCLQWVHPTTIEQMASDAVTFIWARGFDQVDLFGFSMGGMIAHAPRPQAVLCFTRTPHGRAAGNEFLSRLEERTNDRDKPISIRSLRAQLKTIHRWGQQKPADLASIHQPVLVMNGESDRMVPSKNSVDLDRRLPNSQLVLYPDAGHGGVFQFHEDFVKRALEFL